MSEDQDDREREHERDQGDDTPRAHHKPVSKWSPLWLVPVAAALLVGYLGYRAFASKGPKITITFKTADGLAIEQTRVKHKAVTLGTVSGIELSEGEDHVLVHLNMDARAESMLTDKANFWVVRPRLQGGAVAALQTGLETLVSGSYIELDPGPSRGAKKEHYVGLEQPPAVRSGEPGTTFLLSAEDTGSLGSGAPILHRQVPVGEVLDSDLDEKTGHVTIRAFVRAPYDRLVVPSTCFWNASGLDIGMGASGLHVEVSSMRSLLSGGIEFATPSSHGNARRVEAEHMFPLFANEDAAEIALNGEATPYVVYFSDSVQGLTKGSPVKLFGLQVGTVTETNLALDPMSQDHPRIVARVGLVLQPQRALSGPAAQALDRDHLREQAAHGLEVVLETSSYVTGEKALALSYAPKARAATLRQEGDAFVLPSRSGGITAITDSLGQIATRLNDIPYENIGRSLNHALASVDRAVSGPDLPKAIAGLSSTLDEVRQLAQEARQGLSPTLQRLPSIAQHVDEAVANANAALTNLGGSDGEFQRKTQRLLREVADMARSVRLLADFLEKHPETLLRGRETEKGK